MSDIFKKSFLEGYASQSLSVGDIVMCMVCTVVMAIYIYGIYRCINRRNFVNKNFTLSLIAMAVITAAIIVTIQSNIVISLGMVGALSIVRFRTAVKDPMDLVFLFWSISAGIICGAGLALVAVIASVVVTVVVVLFSRLPESGKSQILVVNASDYTSEKLITSVAKKHSAVIRVKARNMTKESLDMTIEVWPKNESKMIDELMSINTVYAASLVAHDGDSVL